MASSTVECPCCCAACENADECCTFDGEATYEPPCTDICKYRTEGDDGGFPAPNMFTQTVTRTSNTPNCESCEQKTEQEVQGCKDCPCECSWLGDEWTSTRPTNCRTVETRVVSSSTVGLPAGGCLTRTCYRCLENDGDCSGCEYDQETISPSSDEFCCWSGVDQTVTRTSSQPGCENCKEETDAFSYGTDYSYKCPCEALSGGNWKSTVPADCDHVIEADVSGDDVGLGCPPDNCVSQTCYKCDEGEEGCYAVASVSGAAIGSATCKTNMSANWDNACRFGSMREAAEMGASVGLTVSCPENDFCAGKKEGTFGLQDCSFSGAGSNTVSYKFEDCGLNDPDFEVTITLEECPPEECLGPNP